MAILLISLVLLLILGVPIAYSLGVSGMLYFIIEKPELISVLPQRFFAGMQSYSMIALPLFCLMGSLMNSSGITGRLIDFLYAYYRPAEGRTWDGLMSLPA